jgi:flagellar basal body-associated protein FliL
MAEDQEQSFQAGAEGEASAPKMKKGLPKPLLLAGILIPVLAFSAFSSQIVIKKIFFPDPQPVKKEAAKSEVGEFHMISDLIINPAASGGRRHLMVSLGLEYADPLLKAELEKRDPQIRDNLITILAGQEANVLTDIRYRESIRQSLLKAVNYHLESGTVEKLYFTKYVFQ